MKERFKYENGRVLDTWASLDILRVVCWVELAEYGEEISIALNKYRPRGKAWGIVQKPLIAKCGTAVNKKQ